MEEVSCDVIIIGAGPAGLTAGIYTKRANLDTIVFSGKSPPRIILAHKIENYPGFIEPITGEELLTNMRKQAERLGVTINDEDIISFFLDAEEKMVSSKDKVYKSKVVIIAIGLGPRRKTFLGEEKFVGRGVSYCAKCDGPLFRGRNVILVGNDNETGEEALDLLGMDVKVSIYTNAEELKMEENTLNKLKNLGIKVNKNLKIKEIYGTNSVAGVKLENAHEVSTDGIFISHTIPSSMLLQNAGLDLGEKGCIKVNKLMETNIKGVFAAGDVVCEFDQVSTAVGSGATAALSAIKYIRELK